MINVKQNDLVSNLKVVGELITNKILALDTSYLKIVSIEGVQYLVGFGSQHDLIIKIGDNKDSDDYSANVEYGKLLALVGYMQEDITLEADNEGVLTKDNSVETYLNNIMADNTDIEDVTDILTNAGEVKEKGFRVKREDFYNTLRYLRGIQERDERTDLETGVMFAKDATYVVSDLYAVRHNFGLGENLVLDGHVTRVLLSLISNSKDEEFIIAKDRGVTFFYVGDNVYRVDGLSDDITDQYKEVFNHPGAKDTIEMEKRECLRVLNLTKVFTDATEPDITFDIKDKKGRIYAETQDGDKVDSEFLADKCTDVSFTVSVEDMISVIGKLPNDVAEQLDLDVVLLTEEDQLQQSELLHFKHELGDCVFSINRDI